VELQQELAVPCRHQIAERSLQAGRCSERLCHLVIFSEDMQILIVVLPAPIQVPPSEALASGHLQCGFR
jgi:hypothetical protein